MERAINKTIPFYPPSLSNFETPSRFTMDNMDIESPFENEDKENNTANEQAFYSFSEELNFTPEKKFPESICSTGEKTSGFGMEEAEMNEEGPMNGFDFSFGEQCFQKRAQRGVNGNEQDDDSFKPSLFTLEEDIHLPLYEFDANANCFGGLGFLENILGRTQSRQKPFLSLTRTLRKEEPLLIRRNCPLASDEELEEPSSKRVKTNWSLF